MRAGKHPITALAAAGGLLARVAGTGCVGTVQYMMHRRASGQESLLAWEFPLVDSWAEASAPGLPAKRLIEGSTRRQLPGRWASLTSTVAHWIYGSAWASLYRVMCGSLGEPHIPCGPPSGAVVWISGYLVLPEAGPDKPIWEYDDKTLAATYGARAFEMIRFPAQTPEVRSRMARTRLAELAAWAKGQLPGLIDDAYDAILDRIPVYRRDQLVPPEDLRRSVASNLRFMVNAIGRPEAPLDLAAPQETGRRRAHQGVPLPEVLQAYRISFATLWDALVEHVRRSGQPAMADALLTAASMIWQLTDEHALLLTEAHRAATAELLLAQQRRRSALVEALLTGHPGPEVGPWEAATLLGLPPDAHLVVVAADTQGLAEESLPGIERRLATRGIVSGWRLTPALQLGVVSLQADQLETVLSVLREAASTRTGLSPPYRSLTDTPRALQLARTALAVLPAGRAEVRVFSSSPLAALVAVDPGEGRRLARDVLGGVLELPPEDRAILLDTLNAYLDHEGSAKRAAEVLFCHTNTVRYRLRRLHELTGRSLSDPDGIAELAAAAYALRISPDVTPRRRRASAANGRARPAPGRSTGPKERPGK